MVLVIALNVIFAAAVIVGIVTLLAHSIRAQAAVDTAPAPRARTRERLKSALVPVHSA